MNPLIDTWRIHNRINLYLLDHVEEKHLADVASSRGRSVGEQFAHIHNVRLMWIKSAAPEILETVRKIEKETTLNKSLLHESLEQSGNAIERVLENGLKENRIRGFKPHPEAFVGYLISHESHHRGQIMLCLKQSGHPVDRKVQYGMWEWGSR